MSSIFKILFFWLFAFCVFGLKSQTHIFYLHGKIVENQGPNAIEEVNGYGSYQYYPILDSLKKSGAKIYSEVREKNTDIKLYAKKITQQIDSLLKRGIAANRITVIGASKGATIAMYVSTYLKNMDVNFVFMAACYANQSINDMNWCGNILSIYEKSDGAGTCIKFKQSSQGISHYKEIELHTGLGHGFLFKPLSDWIYPSIAWSKGNYK